MREEERNKLGKRASMVAIGANCFLTVLNIVVGLFGGSSALVAEGLHTFSDIITSIIAYIGFKIAQRPANERFPEGYGRAEALSGLVIVIFLTFISFEIMDMAFEKLQNLNAIATPDIYVVVMAVFGIFANLIISRYIIRIGEKINSPAIVADGKHQQSDIFVSVTVLLGVAVAKLGFPILDPIIGFFIGLLILKTAYGIGKKNLLHIMGFVPEDDELIENIKCITNEVPNASNAHNIVIANHASYMIVDLHINVDSDVSVREAYEISCQVEQAILKLPNIKSVSAKPCPFDENHD